LGNETREFRSSMGQIVASQAGNGILMSGDTIRQCLAEAERCLERGITDCLKLVSNRTQHNGKHRQAMLSILRDVTEHHAKHIARIIEERFERIEAFQGSAKVASDFEFHQMVERRIDQINAFSDGLTAPPDEHWTKRHPLVAGAAGAAVAIVVGALLGFFGPITDHLLSLFGLE